MSKRLSKLLESELDRAEIILAVKNMSQDIQDMLEKVAKMRVDTLMPLVDRVKEVFSQQEGEQFMNMADSALETLQDQLTQTKDEVENQSNVLNGEAPAQQGSDMMAPDLGNDSDMGAPNLGKEPAGMGGEEDMFGADDSNVGGDEPLGRAKKESIRRNKIKLLKEKENLRNRIRVLEAKIKKVRI